jgi:hypothetical protein
VLTTASNATKPIVLKRTIFNLCGECRCPKPGQSLMFP